MPVFGPLGASVTVNVTSATQTFALPVLPSRLPAVRLVGRQANQVAWYIKFGTGATTVSRTDGKRVDVGSIDFPLILGVPAGATHIAILCEGPPGDVTITSGSFTESEPGSFAPLGASQIVAVTQIDQTIALPALGATNPAIQLVGMQANMVSLFLKFGTGAVVGDRDTSMQVRPGAIAAPTIVGVPAGATHLSIFCEGSPGGVILTAGGFAVDDSEEMWLPISSGTISGVANLDIPIPAGVDGVEIDLVEWRPVTDNVSLYMRFSQGGSFLSGAADYAWGNEGGDDVSDSEIEIQTGSIGNAANEFLAIKIRVYRPNVIGAPKSAVWNGAYVDTATLVFPAFGRGRLIANTNPIDGVRFLFSSGNMADGFYAARAFRFS